MADAKGAYIGGVPVQFKDAAARAMISDEYNSAETYAKGNLCIYNGKIYEAIKETTGTWDATAWEETTLAKVNGKLNGDIASLTEKQQVIKEAFVQSQTDTNGNLYLGIKSSEIWILDAWSVDGCVTVGLTSESEYVLHCSTWTNWNRGVLDITVWYTYVKR